MTSSTSKPTQLGGFDSGRLDELVAQVMPRVVAIVRRYPLGPDDVEDVVQHVWLQLLVNLHRIDHQICIVSWVRTTSNRAAIKAANRARREVPAEPATVAQWAAVTVSPEHELIRAEHARALHAAIARLPYRERRCARLMLLHPHLSYAELGLRLGMAESSIGSLRSRCLRRLQRRLVAGGITDAGC